MFLLRSLVDFVVFMMCGDTASGKRFRRQFNPNDWESSILTVRHNVLCLGMSYPCVDAVLSIQEGNLREIFHSAPSVERSVELVRRNILNQIDGRDLARVVALEADNDILAYTVSKAEGSYYEQRHLNANFNTRTLVDQMHKRWGTTVKFKQVILDYFWSPSGSWAIKHWQRSFFNDNIPRFVTGNLLNFGDMENEHVFVSAKEANVAEDYVTSTAAVVYLPFCSHCLSQVVACYDKLSQYYAISFLRKDELDEHTLWKATNTISPASMKGWLAKTINQEDIYCALDERQIKSSIFDEYVTKESVLEVFRMIARSGEVRIIKLTALVMYHPNYAKSDYARWTTPTLGVNKGGFVFSRCGTHLTISSCAAANKAINKKQVEQPNRRSHSKQQLDKSGRRKRGKRDGSLMKRALTSDNRAIAPRTDHPSEPSNKELTAMDSISLEWERILASLESEYAERVNLCAGIVSHKVLADKGYTDEEAVGGINGPSASFDTQMTQANHSLESSKEVQMSENIIPLGENMSTAPLSITIAKRAIAKISEKRLTIEPAYAVSTVSDRRDVLEADEVDAVSEVTPSVNDVVMGEKYHSHPGNVQFFDALKSCGLSYSEVADCFAGALKSLNPPGRFLVRDEWNNCWAVIDDERALALVPHLVDHYTLNRLCDASPNSDSSSVFLCAIQRHLYQDKPTWGDHQSNVSDLSDTSITDSTAIPQEAGLINEGGHASWWEPIVPNSLRNGNSNNEGMSTRIQNSRKRSRTNEGKLKRSASQHKRKRNKADKPLALALAEFEATYKMDNSNCTEKFSSFDDDGGEASLASSVAKDNIGYVREIAKEAGLSRPASVAVSVSIAVSWSSLVEELAEITVSTAIASVTTTDTSDVSVLVAEDSMTSANSTSADAVNFRCLAEWLQPSIDCTQANVDSIEIALRQISDLGKCSVYQLLTHAFEEETAALRSLCTKRN